MKNKKDPQLVTSLKKGMKVFDAFYGANQYLRFSDIVESTGFSKSAVQRYVYTWTTLGFLYKNPKTKQYRLTPKALDLAYSFLHSSPLIEIAVPHLIDLRNRHNETAHLSFKDGIDLVYVFRTPSQRHTLNASIIGRRLPLCLLSGGRAMLSTLPDEEIKRIIEKSHLNKRTPYTTTDPDKLFESIVKVRNDGYSIVVQEALLGEIAVAAPVVNSQFDILAAVHIIVTMKDWTSERVIKELAPDVMSVARIIAGQ